MQGQVLEPLCGLGWMTSFSEPHCSSGKGRGGGGGGLATPAFLT